MQNQIPSSSSNLNVETKLPVVSDPNANTLGSPGAPPPWMMGEEEKEGFDIGGFLHSLRRRWIIGLGLGFIFASIVAGLLWVFVPVESEAVVLIRITRPEESALRSRPALRMTATDFEVFKQTQADLIKTSFVMNAALRQPGISNLEIVKNKPWGGKRKEPAAWLERELKVSSPEGTEIVQLSFKERNEEEVIRVLNAIKDAYMHEVIHKESVAKTTDLERMRVRKRRIDDELKRKLETVKSLAEEFGSTQSESSKLRIDLAFKTLNALERDRADLSRQLRQLRHEFYLVRQEHQASLGYQPKDWELEDALVQVVPEYGMLKGQLLELKQSTQGSGMSTSGGRMQAQTSQILAEMDRLKSEKKKEIADRLKSVKGSDQNELQRTLNTLQGQMQMLSQEAQAIQAKYNEQVGLLSSLGKSNVELQILQMELANLNKVNEKLTEEIEALELEMEHKDSINVMHNAEVPDASSWMVKYLQISGSWLLTLTATLFGVALWDFQSKRLNSSKDIADRADIRVIGSLPSLSGRRAGGLLAMSDKMRKTIEGGLGRAIDSIRTALLLSKTTRAIEVVMVTSALGQEGKTTVASQLAVSLARSGRRTLLIDGDVRNPQQHVVLNMPFNAGLCELIRSDVTLEDVVKATPAEGLWFLGAGYRDPQTDQYLASPNIAELFDDLKSRFDIIVIDTGPVLTSPDAMLLGQHADSAVLSSRRDISRMPKIREAADRLRSVGVEISGAVINGISIDIRERELAAPVVASNDPQIEQNAATDSPEVAEVTPEVADVIHEPHSEDTSVDSTDDQEQN